MPQELLQPAPVRTPFFAKDGQIHEEWRRFFLSNQTLVNLLLQQLIAGTPHPSLVSAEDNDPSDPFIVPGPAGPPGGQGPQGIPSIALDDTVVDEPIAYAVPSTVAFLTAAYNIFFGRLQVGAGTDQGVKFQVTGGRGAFVANAEAFAFSFGFSAAQYGTDAFFMGVTTNGGVASSGQFQLSDAGGNGLLTANNTAAGTNPGLISLLKGQLQFPTAANPSTDAQTLDQYKEGTWTPADGSGAGLSLTIGTAQFVKIGQLVYVSFDLSYPVTANGANARISGLPFTTQAAQSALEPSFVSVLGSDVLWLVRASNTVVDPFTVSGANVTNAQLSGLNLIASGCYRAAS